MAGVLFNGNLVLLLVYNIVVLAAGRRVEKKDGGDIDKKIMLARCTSRCLTLHITKLSATFRSLQNDDILTWCGNKRRCSQCLQPCMGNLDSKPKQCHRKCENHHECVTSCEFLRSLQVTRQGQCPPPHRASGFAAACVLSCSADRECPGKKKCCANGCGFTCQMPVNMFKGVPLKPHSELIYNEHTNRSVEIIWKSRFNISAEPVLYILQRRWNYGIQPNEDQSTPWQTIAVTAAHQFNMIGLRPGRWYQFQVAAVNAHGTHGFTTPSRHFHSTKDPLPPDAPNDLRVDNLTFARNGTVSVHIIWAAPKEQDLKIHHYRISWNSSAIGELQSKSKTNSWRITDGANTEITLDSLLPNTEYLVKIQAVSYWRQKRMKSLQSQIIISTTQQDSKSTSRKSTVDECNDIGKSYKASCKSTLRAYSFYHNNQIQIKLSWKAVPENYVEPYTYLIKWTPSVCDNNGTFSDGKAVVKGSNFIITGLQLACKYKITVRPFTLQGPLVEEVTYVKTPKCNNMKVKSLKHGRCSRRGRHRLSRNVMHTPEKLSAAFHSVNGRIEGEFHWHVLQSEQSHTITAFLFSWEEISETTRVYNTRTLPAAHTFTFIENMKPSTSYYIKVQVISRNQNISSTEKTVHTPAVGL